MVYDAKVRGHEFINFLTKNNYLKSCLGKNDLVISIFIYISTAVSLIHKSFKKEVKSKLFNIVLSLLPNATNDAETQLLRTYLLAFTATDANREVLRQIYEGTHPTIKLDFPNTEKWRVLIRLYLSERYSCEEKKSWIDALAKEDTSDLAKNYQLTLAAMTNCPTKLEELWK